MYITHSFSLKGWVRVCLDGVQYHRREGSSLYSLQCRICFARGLPCSPVQQIAVMSFLTPDLGECGIILYNLIVGMKCSFYLRLTIRVDFFFVLIKHVLYPPPLFSLTFKTLNLLLFLKMT